MFYSTNPIIMCTYYKKKKWVVGGVVWVFFTAIIRLLDLLRGGSNLWLNPADDSLADLRIFQRLKCRCLDFSKPHENFKNIRPTSLFPRYPRWP